MFSSFISNKDFGRSEPDFAAHADTVPWYLRYRTVGTYGRYRYRRYLQTVPLKK